MISNVDRNLLKLPSMPKISACERGFPGRSDSLALCLGIGRFTLCLGIGSFALGGNLIESWKNIVEKVLKCIGMGIRSKVIFTGLAPSTSSCCPSPLIATFLKRQSRFLKKMQKIPLTAFTFNIRDRPPLSSVLSWENLFSNLGPKAAVVTLVFGRGQSKITNKLSSKYTDSFKQPLGGFCCAGASFLSGSSENNNKSLCLD